MAASGALILTKQLIAAPVWVRLLVLLISAGIPSVKADKACDYDRNCLRQKYVNHAVKTVEFWSAFQSLPIERRILAAPSKLIDYLLLDNQQQGFPNRPVAAKPSRQFMLDIRAAVSEMPPHVIQLIDSRLMGIFLVQDLGGTGMTDYVYNEDVEPVGAFVVLDIDVLTRSANEWASWKENTPFEPDAEFQLQAMIENVAEDNRKQALQYIVLHELGHVASVGRNYHPRWDDWDCNSDPPEKFPFFELSWVLSNSSDCSVVSRFDAAGFSLRPQVVYYFGARLPLSQSTMVYEQLKQTNFPSLYAATSPADDFAEAFVTYVHQVLMDKPFEVRIKKRDQLELRFEGCWGLPACERKQSMMSGVFAGSINRE